MGFHEEIEALELDDATKDKLRREHEAEVDPLKKETGELRRETRRESVEREIAELSDAGFEDEPGALKFYRRVMLSDDGEVGAVLLSDTELQFSAEQATGATTKETKTTAETLKTFVGLLSRNSEGKLKIALSDQASEEEADGKPETGDPLDPSEKTKQHRESAEGWSGRKIERTRSRYTRDKVPAGGGS